ncbi:cardiolipin synthase [Aquimarina amphilecti]|uniref:Cardiolipin synthase n=1 Tax=Aquimarina amphilecti TaxID=1038014 RepID=A0A1H7UFN5_AQUAM|nr:cardiolipin synthase [Aquimarina amphilecti]SEL95629.1 cardiolipin synthase [Aquimarina amphilecti]
MIIAISIYCILTALSIVHIILYGSRPTKSLSWLLVVLIFPILGILLYVIFGINRRRFKFFKLKQTIRRRLYDENFKEHLVKKQQIDFNDESRIKLSKLMRNSSNFSTLPGNEVRVLQNGKETFDTIFKELEKAEKFIHLQYYIFEEGELVNRLYKLVKNKLNNNVEVRILYDAIGSYSLRKKIIKKFKDIGAKVYPIMPLNYGSFLFTLNYRNHRKIIIIDGKIGFTGGVNISDKYIKPNSELGIWDDTHLYLNGPAVDHLHRVFIKDYYFASNQELLLTDKYLPEIKNQGNVAVQIIAGGPDSDHPSIMQQYITMINLAKKYIYISNPYFIPNSAMLEALRIAALSGVSIKLLVPKKSDSWLAKYSMLSFFEELLFLGIEVYQQNNDFLHSKVIIMDGDIASVGSGNFDHRSFEHNFETNALIYDRKISQNICDDFISDCNKSILLNFEDYKRRSLKRKLSEGIARFFSPLL